ncbi:molybdate ABC transporter substrate-binding protein [Deinococcus detaillensis]|uniref:Molybdate ABC transporter substrate-binding protein n=1 Tax=Deinococcus detaillensis TaxID=2592048 RepID=A0A553V4Y7_9DEIO|nr:molybdate ABC transporter substrate-binding protein [Deinococcus detaillensis]TSA87543.1 molybdate ABC transporter substrate-binding protein [Deinococcus detaillensis]
MIFKTFKPLLLTCLALGLSSASAAKVTVFAAASLTDAFSEIGQQFDAKTGNTTTFQFAGSQALRTQLEQGAKADVFASANSTQFDPLVKSGSLGAGQTFARNRLVVIAPRGNAAVGKLADLARPGVKLVLADKSVPVGDYSRKTLDLISKAGTYGTDFSTRVLKNVVSEEPNVRQVAVKIQLGQGDAAIVYVSDVTPSLKSDVRTIGLPTRFNPLASYPIGVLKGGNTAEGQAFVDYVLSNAGQAILKKWGFVGAK